MKASWVEGCILLCAAVTVTHAVLSQSGTEVHYSESGAGPIRSKRDLTSTVPSDASSTTTPLVSIHEEDRTNYYHIQYIRPEDGGRDLWRDLTNTPKGRVVKHTSLQNAYRLAVKINLGFEFQFYGHSVSSVTIATGGFLYMSEFLHSFLTASQYISPLMANFNTSIGNESEILYREEEDALVVQWNNVYLNDRKDLGAFTFQVQLYKKDGKIIAAYNEVPTYLANLSSNAHPVKVGLSDAYYWDVGQYRTIYPYHTFNASQDKVVSDSAIIFIHRKTCNMLNDCDTCLNDPPPGFKCYWCSAINLCSDSFDRQRQTWIMNGCLHNTTQTHCDQLFTTLGPMRARASEDDTTSSEKLYPRFQTWKAVTAALCTVFGLTAAVMLALAIYGYRNPQTILGQYLVRNRPSELWRKFKSWKDKDPESSNHMSQIG